MSTEIWNIFNELKLSLNDDNDNDNNNDNDNDNDNNEFNNKQKSNNICEDEKYINNKKKCINCLSDKLINDNEFVVCCDCGADNGPIIDHSQEWRYYGNDDNKKGGDPTRCGLPINPLIPESSLGTIVLGRGFEVYTKLNRWNGMSYRERSLINVLSQINSKIKDGNIPGCIVDKTIAMYKILSEERIKRGESRESLIAACLLNALKDKDIPRSSCEISDLFGIKNKKLSKGCNQFSEIMHNKNGEYLKKFKPTEPKDLINRYCDILDIEDKHREYSLTVANISDKLGICSENNPKSIAVGSIYLVSQIYRLGFTKKDIASKCKTSEVTISKTYTEMLKYQKYLLPNGD